MPEIIPTDAALSAIIRSIVADEVDKRLRAAGAVQAVDCRSLRIQRGLSIVELAHRAGISHPALSRIESGRTRRPAAATLNRIAQALGVSEQAYRTAFAAQKAGAA